MLHGSISSQHAVGDSCHYSLDCREGSFSETHGSKLVGGRLNCLSGVTISALIHSATRVFVWLVARIRCKQAQVVAAELPENLSCVAYRPATQNTTQD